MLVRAGRPVARITRLAAPAGIRFGTAKGLIKAIDPAFDKPLTKKQRDALFGGAIEP